MQEPLVTISLREYQALKDLYDQFYIIRQNARYTQYVDDFSAGDEKKLVAEISQMELDALFKNLLSVDVVYTKERRNS